MKHNIIQITAMAGLTVPHSINPILQVHFRLSGQKINKGNKQTCRIWGSENSNVIIEKPVCPQRVTVWCGLWHGGIIGPFFFENEQGATVTINGERYYPMLIEFFFQKIEEGDMDDIWF